MSDLIEQAQAVRSLIKDPTLSKEQRLSRALEACTETGLVGDLPKWSEGGDVQVASPQRDGDSTADAHDVVSCGADVQEMLQKVDDATARIIDLELDRIVADLDKAGSKLPVAAIEEARRHRELIVPKLIDALNDAASEARADRIPEGNGHFFVLFLLTEFRAQEAFPAILEVMSLPGELPVDLFGDAITETLARILALFAANTPDVLDELIADPSVNEYVRWEAAQTYVYLVRDGKLTRDEAVRRLHQQLREAIERQEAFIVGAIISELICFSPKEALGDIQDAYDQDLVDLSLIGFRHVEESIAGGDARVQQSLDRCLPTGIEDTLEELRHWHAFREEPPKPPPMPRTPHFMQPRQPLGSAFASVSSPSRRVGRNDPCPCGSGKKFKKCCGSRP